MKLKYSAEAFTIAIVLFSAGLKASFIAGILVILAVTFAEFLKNLLEPYVPDWSLKSCIFIGTASISASAFTLGFSALSIPVEIQTWILAFVIGMFAAKHVLINDLDADYGSVFWESGIVWGIWLLLAIVREFLGSGKIFGNFIMKTTVQSKSLQEVFFGFITAGLVLAITNAILKKRSTDTHSILVVLPIIVLARPFAVERLGVVAGIIWTIIVPLVMFLSVKKTLKFSRMGQAFCGLPIEMMSMGFIYMILSIY